MSSPRLEAFLARLYADRAALESFLSDSDAACGEFGLDEAECRSMRSIDVTGLKMAAHSFAHKRALRSRPAHAKPLRAP